MVDSVSTLNDDFLARGGGANQASIVRGVTPAGNGVVLFGTDPTFRPHAKGLHSQLGRAVLWAARR